ncbi:methyl-accepting chemotaxis protein [Halogeometricum luteum]|uniref:Methyl-accepting chemotaxis protein n=1 Tax=Halogeometricum luteum TaxID=2950537 RepID=A0ABU2FX34_9EURY|nr:methyl-accepting chemotaxis protein [Halogeometricum sp. S3BR5-2]MDS0293101.1 methyl-accepting chemotaxis protein [Halogeometricum sp. S3BR5-2]
MNRLRSAVRRVARRAREFSAPNVSLPTPNAGPDAGALVPRQIRRSYARKLASLFLVVIVLFAGVAAFEYRTVAAEVQSNAHADVQETARLQANQLGEWMQQRRETTRMLSSYEMYDTPPYILNENLKSERTKLPLGYTAIHYADARSGDVVASSNDSLVGERPWGDADFVSEAGSRFADDVVRSDPYTAPSGERVVAFASSVPSRPNGVLVATVDVSALESRLETSMNGSVVTVVSQTGTPMFASNGAEAAGLDPDSPILSRATSGKSGVLEREADGAMDAEHLLAYAPSGDGSVVLVSVPTSTAYALQDTVGTHVLLIVGLAVVSLAGVGYVLRRITVRPLDDLSQAVSRLRSGELDAELEADREDEFGEVFAGVAQMRDDLRDQRADADAHREVMERTAAGDLTARMDEDSRSREMATIAGAFNGMMDEMESTVVAVSRFGEDVASLSDEVAESTERVSETSLEVSQSIEQISSGAEEQSESLTRVTQEVNDLSASVQQIASAADELSSLSARTADRARGGADAAEDALAGMDDIRTETERTVAEVDRLDDRLGEVGDVVAVITDVAEQTNVLALNAQIEAARAGEDGAGFAVVSREVKALAEETRDSAAEISALVEDIGEQRERVVERVERMRDGVRDGAEDVDGALRSLDDVVERIEETDASVREITDATGGQAASAQEVLATADGIASIAEEMAGEAGAVATAAEGQTTTLGGVDDRMQSLSADTGRLVAVLDRFETRESAVEDGALDGAGVGGDAASDPVSGPGADPAPTPTADGGRVRSEADSADE